MKQETNNVVSIPRPWDRRPDEGDEAWEAFIAYRDLPEKERSPIRVAEIVGKSDTMARRWRRRFEWEARVYRYDLYMRGNQMKAHAEEVHNARAKQKAIATKMLTAIERALDEGMGPMEPKDIPAWFKAAVEVQRIFSSHSMRTPRRRPPSPLDADDLLLDGTGRQ